MLARIVAAKINHGNRDKQSEADKEPHLGIVRHLWVFPGSDCKRGTASLRSGRVLQPYYDASRPGMILLSQQNSPIWPGRTNMLGRLGMLDSAGDFLLRRKSDPASKSV